MIVAYISLLLELSYNFGRHLGACFILQPYLNRNLKYMQGESILAIQSYLFVRTCLIENELIKLKMLEPTPWKKSFLLDQVFGGFIGKYKKKINGLYH